MFLLRIKKSFLDQPAGELVVESEPKSVGFSGEDIFPDSTQADIAQWRKTSSDFYRSSALDMSSKVVKPSSADDGTLFSHSLEQLNYRANPDFIYTGIRRISSVGDIGNLVKDMDAVMNSDLLTKNPELYMQILGEVVGVSSISLSSLHARLNNLLNDEGLAGGDTLLDLTIQTLTKLKTSYKTSLRTGKQKARFAPISLDVNPENQSDYNNAKIAFLNKVIELANPLFPKKMRFFQLGK